jgi:cyclic-di-GMP-binding protein
VPSFDVVSEVDLQEVRNAVDQGNREVGQRFDFKGSDARFEQKEAEITLHAANEFQLRQMMEILEKKLAKRNVDLACLDRKEPELSGSAARQRVVVRQGIDTDTARRIVKDTKESKLKVQAQIQGEQVRITGKQRDDLQNVIAVLRSRDYQLPLQFINFRD